MEIIAVLLVHFIDLGDSLTETERLKLKMNIRARLFENRLINANLRLKVDQGFHVAHLKWFKRLISS